jgi:S-adenosylmethionine:tRNA ribosyltransferase-isomerase
VHGETTSDYAFDLPTDLVAQVPLADRAASRLMVVRRDSESIEHLGFSDIVGLIPSDDLLVLNTTRVIRARLLGRRASGAPAEILLLKPVGGDRWEAMVSPGGKLRPGRTIEIAPELSVEVLETTERRTRIVRLRSTLPDDVAIERFGRVPLPPYIARADTTDDANRYQTVYARERGSVAAPTAGLHFTQGILDQLERRGVRRASVVLHVGAGTFKPVETENPSQHVMHEEHFEVPRETADSVSATKRAGHHVWAVGTTSVRTLESAADADGQLRATGGDTALFIRPPYRFRVVDRMLTNFHLPRSTLVMLVAAFAGYELTMRAYREAVAARYRFFSYGDAMLIV